MASSTPHLEMMSWLEMVWVRQIFAGGYQPIACDVLEVLWPHVWKAWLVLHQEDDNEYWKAYSQASPESQEQSRKDVYLRILHTMWDVYIHNPYRMRATVMAI